MAGKCYICGKGKSTGHKISHSNIKTKRRWSPNIQKVKAMIKGSPKRIAVCTKCIKSGKVERAV
ncbi:MAG: 50S ribosomal protein L28 [Firmicutes bacterium]|nr:50S ribosomal protein L28 [Bacillota bacterium]